MSLQSRLGLLITAIGADIKERVTLSTAQVITGVKTYPPGTLLMRNAAGTLTAEPYSDINAPDTLERTIQATTPATPPTGESVEWTTDGKSLDMRAADGTLTRIGPTVAGAADIKQTEIDFGVTPRYVQTFTVTDATVAAISQVNATQAGDAPTGRSQDENEFEALIVRAAPGTGQFTLYVSAVEGPLVGKYKINYLVG